MTELSWIDWAVMLTTLFTIVTYGVWKTRGSKNIESYLLGDKAANWWTIGLSVMATQASAITFLSTPGQAYMEGMGFVQFYFGLPLAMIIISAVFIPLYYRLKVYTAYEFLESRFDNKTRALTAILFLIQRGLAAGITIYAPAIILSQIVGWSLNFTILFIGILVIIYTVSGGTKAVSQTHKQQMGIIFLGMFIAFGMLISFIGDSVDFGQSLDIAGAMGKLNIIDTEFNPESKYNIWSGLIGGLFLQLSYFGTDQSQVQRYLSGSSVRESRLGLMFNGLLKIPMQFFILFVGVMVFVFYQFTTPPIHFNEANITKVENSIYAEEFQELENNYNQLIETKKQAQLDFVAAKENGETTIIEQQKTTINQLQAEADQMREESKALILKVDENAETKDDDYIFITFVINYLPIGIIGLLLAVIFSAAMSSTSSELNALGSTATVDMYKRNFRKEGSETHYLKASKLLTGLFGVFAILFATLASLFENLIEAVNILGSLFYGTILGVFLVAFFFKYIKGNAIFVSAVISQVLIGVLFYLNRTGIYEIGYLWYNLIGPALVIFFGFLFQAIFPKKKLI